MSSGAASIRTFMPRRPLRCRILRTWSPFGVASTVTVGVGLKRLRAAEELLTRNSQQGVGVAVPGAAARLVANEAIGARAAQLHDQRRSKLWLPFESQVGHVSFSTIHVVSQSHFDLALALNVIQPFSSIPTHKGG